MNKNVKNGALLALAATAGLTSCSRYEEGPFSLRSPQNRLEGEWELKDCEDKDVKDFLDNGGEILFEFDKDGDVKVSLTYEYTYTWYGYSFSYEWDYDEDGDWEFNNKKKEIQLDFGSNSWTEYILDEEWDIIRLSKKELKLEDEDGDEYEFEKK